MTRTATLTFIEGPALEDAWSRLYAQLEEPHAPDLPCPSTGEVWQYMGTTYKPGGARSLRELAAHQFRHRSYNGPRLAMRGSRVYADVPADRSRRVTWRSVPYGRFTVQSAPERPTVAPEAPAQPDDSASRRRAERLARMWDDGADYGGAFDGFSVSSDADPGL